MNNEERIFEQVLTKESAAEQAEYLDEACGGDAVLRAELEKLLGAHRRAEGVLEVPAVAGLGARTASLAFPSPEAVGATVGPYTLLEQIGGGGMGVVYM